jgi:hypothetical protein
MNDSNNLNDAAEQTRLRERTVKPTQLQTLMTKTSILFAAAFLLPTLAFPADYNLGELAKAKNIDLLPRKIEL